MVFPISVQRDEEADWFSYCRGGAGEGRGDNNLLLGVDSCRIFCPAMPGPCWLWSCVPAGCLNSCCATGVAQFLTCPQDQSHRAVRMSREGRDRVSSRLVVTNQGCSTRRCPCRWMLCSRTHLGWFSLSCCSSVLLAFRTAFCAAFPSHAFPH